MTADDARKLLLVRAFEHPVTAPWTAADGAWASAEAARRHGEQAGADALMAARAGFATQRLAERDPAVARTLEQARLPTGWGWALVLLAFVLGCGLDAIGPSGRLNIVALPLLGMLGWNLVVYALLAFGALRANGRATGANTGSAWLRRALEWQPPWRSVEHRTAALARFAADWSVTSWPLAAQRIATVLHAAAAALAAGMLASLYLRGLLVTEYRAGWDSTFFTVVTPEVVHRLLAVALGPALAFGGFALPTPEELAALRFSAGTGENAERWIHAWALTVALLVLLPRALLALLAGWRAQRLERALPLAPELLHVPGLHPARLEATVTVQLLPCNYRLDVTAQAALPAALEARLGARVRLQLAESLPLDAEENLAARLPPPEPGAALLPLLALTATPERETHGAFLAALAPYRRGPWPRLVLIDESGFRRFDATRRAQRRAAWQAMLADLGLEAGFIDLGGA